MPMLTVYECKTDQSHRLPKWCSFYLVDAENDDVYVPAKFLSNFEKLVFMSSGELFIYDGPVKQIRHRAFVSAKAMAEDDKRFEQLRVKILDSFRKCETIVDSFD